MPEEAVRTILVVDEEPQLLQVMRLILGREGYRVLAARTIREAVKIAGGYAGDIHLLLIDALGPEAQNPELLERLCAERPKLKIILMSDADPQAWSRPHAGFLVKPFSPEALCQAVTQALDPFTP